MNLATLHALGFERSTAERVACGSCAALVINGTPAHESGCPNAVHECAGCNELIPMRARWCPECSPS